MVRLKTTAAITATTLLFGGGTVLVDEAQNPYFDTGTKLEIVEQSSIPSAGEHRIQAHKDRPAVTLNKWNDEAGFTVSYDKIQANGSRQFLTDRVEWKAAKEELHAYPIEAKPGMEDAGYEIEVYLKEKPDSNVFNFTIEGAEELDFFYQPELTPQEIAEGASRPNNVIGSYAVYHKTKANHKVGATNYATGKAFHIYRPKAIDANDVEQWAELSYSNGQLTVTVPQDFLDTAAYPVRVDPTFGYTTAGASTLNIPNSTTLTGFTSLVNQYTATAGDILISFSAYTNASSTTSVNSAAYVISGGVPTTQLGSATTTFSINTTADWDISGAVSLPLSGGVIYGTAFSRSDSAGAQMYLAFDGGTPPGRLTCSVSATPNEYLANPFCTVGADSGRHYSLYSTYTAGTPASTATSSQVFINNSATTIQGAQVIIP